MNWHYKYYKPGMIANTFSKTDLKRYLVSNPGSRRKSIQGNQLFDSSKMTKNGLILPEDLVPKESSVRVHEGTNPNSDGVHDSKGERNSYTGWGQKLKLLVYKLLRLN